MSAMVLLCDGGEWIELTDQDAARVLATARVLRDLPQESERGVVVRGTLEAVAQRGAAWAEDPDGGDN